MQQDAREYKGQWERDRNEEKKKKDRMWSVKSDGIVRVAVF